MSGHSKWSSIKHKMGKIDAKRGQLFTKLARDVTMAARGGADRGLDRAARQTRARRLARCLTPGEARGDRCRGA